jgi:hypothetical protein
MSRPSFSRLSESKIDSMSKPGIKSMYTLKTALQASYSEIERLTALALGNIFYLLYIFSIKKINLPICIN